MRRPAFEFLLQQQNFGAAAMMVAEFIATIQRIEAAENSGTPCHLPVSDNWHHVCVSLIASPSASAVSSTWNSIRPNIDACPGEAAVKSSVTVVH